MRILTFVTSPITFNQFSNIFVILDGENIKSKIQNFLQINKENKRTWNKKYDEYIKNHMNTLIYSAILIFQIDLHKKAMCQFNISSYIDLTVKETATSVEVVG